MEPLIGKLGRLDHVGDHAGAAAPGQGNRSRVIAARTSEVASDALGGGTTQKTSSTIDPRVVTFAHAMSTPARSSALASRASKPARSVARISMIRVPDVPSNHAMRGGTVERRGRAWGAAPRHASPGGARR